MTAIVSVQQHTHTYKMISEFGAQNAMIRNERPN